MLLLEKIFLALGFGIACRLWLGLAGVRDAVATTEELDFIRTVFVNKLCICICISVGISIHIGICVRLWLGLEEEAL